MAEGMQLNGSIVIEREVTRGLELLLELPRIQMPHFPIQAAAWLP